MPGEISDTRSDEHLLTAHINGDLHAFSTLIRRHQERLWAVAYRTLNNPDDAADALQDALFNAHLTRCREHAPNTPVDRPDSWACRRCWFILPANPLFTEVCPR
ncbi:sigma factor [Gordonia otitidis]|nr:sigma factor [Gordonia otitidis]